MDHGEYKASSWRGGEAPRSRLAMWNLKGWCDILLIARDAGLWLKGEGEAGNDLGLHSHLGISQLNKAGIFVSFVHHLMTRHIVGIQ